MRRPLLAILLVLLLAWAAPVLALESEPAVSPRATALLVSETDSVAPGRTLRIGLYLRLAPGWHTYWQNPGDAGAPPDLTLTLTPGAKASRIAWPVPRRVAEGQLMTYAYAGDVLLPVTITPPASGGLSLKAHAEWLVCRDFCVPEQGDFALDLPAGPGTHSDQAGLFAAADRQLPRPSPWQAVVGRDGTLRVQGPELTPATIADAWFIPATPGTIIDSATQKLTVQNGSFTLALTPGKAFKSQAGLGGILAIRDRSGLETAVALQASPGTVPPAPPVLSLWRILAFAVLGGMILNLMPCVFPVLALKLASLAGAERHRAHWQALAYTGGALVAFTAMGGVLLVARAAGSAAGWGFQFQSPVFVAAMAWVLFAVGLNLSGVYQIGTGLAHTGHGLAARSGHLGSFFTGLLAVVVATPCTAPFMGVAVAAGLAAPPAVTMAVFLAMGLGLAAPYAVLAMVPALGRLAPRPGRWMEVLRQVLAFPMYGASAWLIWVISQEAGPSGVLAGAAGLVMLGFAGWVLGLTQDATDRARRIGQSAAAAAVLIAVAALDTIAPKPGVASDGAAQGAEPFSAVRLAALRAAGRPVFVDMTAGWCVTCLVNERVAIDTSAVRRAFAVRHVAYLRGDWTRQDPEITDYLHENGRDGVPLYVYYPPHDGKPAVLPQILTANTLLAELDRG